MRDVTPLAATTPDELLDNLELRLYPSGEAQAESQFTFHDGSRARVREVGNHITLTLDGALSERRITVRLPQGAHVADCRVDGRPLARAEIVGEATLAVTGKQIELTLHNRQ